jgi:hypothetical protein
MGMRKDFIVSEEEKQRRRKHLEDNRKMTSQRLSTSERIDPLSSSNRLSTAESLSPAFDEIDRVSFIVSIFIQIFPIVRIETAAFSRELRIESI